MVNLPIAYSLKQVTPFGGMSLMKRFIDQTGIREELSQQDLPESGSNRRYNPTQIIESFWLSIWTSASRYIHCDWLRYDTILHSMFGWKEMPSQSTCSRFFGKFSQKRNTNVFPKMQHWFFNQLGIDNLTIDFRLDNFCLKNFWPTKASFRFIMIAYNLMSLFRHFALNHLKRATLKTLKAYCFALGAWTVNHANKKMLKIALPTKKRPWMVFIIIASTINQ